MAPSSSLDNIEGQVKARTALRTRSMPISISSSPDCRIALARCSPPSSAVCCRRGNDAGAGAAAGVERLRRFCFNRGVAVRRAKAERIIDAAQVAFVLPQGVSGVHARLLAADVGLLQRLDCEITWAEAELAQILPRTPAKILTTIPHVAVVRASNYGGAVGDVTRFRNASQVYRLSGLVPRRYESAGKRRSATHISREGKVELREAIVELGKALRQGHPDFARYATELLSRGKPKGVVKCALGQRANRSRSP
jgi:transposase